MVLSLKRSVADDKRVLSTRQNVTFGSAAGDIAAYLHPYLPSSTYALIPAVDDAELGPAHVELWLLPLRVQKNSVRVMLIVIVPVRRRLPCVV